MKRWAVVSDRCGWLYKMGDGARVWGAAVGNITIFETKDQAQQECELVDVEDARPVMVMLHD